MSVYYFTSIYIVIVEVSHNCTRVLSLKLLKIKSSRIVKTSQDIRTNFGNQGIRMSVLFNQVILSKIISSIQLEYMSLSACITKIFLVELTIQLKTPLFVGLLIIFVKGYVYQIRNSELLEGKFHLHHIRHGAVY